ncbi:MAG: hypothetical protein LAN62_13350 [Acidobacteriia bacterium]|nr:hypothetical protein [Terriglobia bacterium]
MAKELGYAINETLADSDRIAGVMGRIRAAGYDLFLVLEVTIGFNKRGDGNVLHRQRLMPEKHSEAAFQLTNQDAQFLRELKISVEDDTR